MKFNSLSKKKSFLKKNYIKNLINQNNYKFDMYNFETENGLKQVVYLFQGIMGIYYKLYQKKTKINKKQNF